MGLRWRLGLNDQNRNFSLFGFRHRFDFGHSNFDQPQMSAVKPSIIDSRFITVSCLKFTVLSAQYLHEKFIVSLFLPSKIRIMIGSIYCILRIIVNFDNYHF